MRRQPQERTAEGTVSGRFQDDLTRLPYAVRSLVYASLNKTNRHKQILQEMGNCKIFTDGLRRTSGVVGRVRV